MTDVVARDHRIVVTDGLTLYCRDYSSAGSRLPVLCLPGLTRNGRDFHELALHLSVQRRVLALDFRGRGLSEHDPDWHRYRLDVYVSDILAVLDALKIPQVIIVGTSLGGLVGMFFGATHPERLAGLVLNDIGPDLDPRGLSRIANSVGQSEPVKSWNEAALAAREGHAAVMPDFTMEDWLGFAKKVYRQREDGVIIRDMDPEIGTALRESAEPAPDFWQAFKALQRLPILTIRGELSDLLAATTVSQMQLHHPTIAVVEIANRGHAPTLDEAASRNAIDHFLERLP
ncbi:MAG: alpha/beta fold hydrolase [Steroidobacteraceae bacterium]